MNSTSLEKKLRALSLVSAMLEIDYATQFFYYIAIGALAIGAKSIYSSLDIHVYMCTYNKHNMQVSTQLVSAF